MKQIAEMIEWLTSEMAKKLEELKIMWDNAMQVLDEFKREFDKMIAKAKEAADKWVAENMVRIWMSGVHILATSLQS